MKTVREELSQLEIPRPTHYRNLTVFPLFRALPETPEPDYLLFDEAITQGLARVTEINGGGSVPELRFENRADRPVLLVDGEELVGAKQNRVLNLTILVPAGKTIPIPVACVEAGRWHYTSPEFAPAPRVMYSRGRASRLGQVTGAMRMFGTRLADQAAVWADIEERAVCLEAQSPTRAMGAMYERHSATIEDYVRAFETAERQAGAAFAISGRIIGLDLFDHPATLRRLFPKLLRSYALDALDAPASSGEPAAPTSCESFMRDLGDAQSFAQPAVGLGKDIRFTARDASGGALWAYTSGAERYVHLCAFSTPGKPESPGFFSRFARASQRRRS